MPLRWSALLLSVAVATSARAQLPEYIQPDARLALAWPSNLRRDEHLDVSVGRDAAIRINGKTGEGERLLTLVRVATVDSSGGMTVIRMKSFSPASLRIRTADAARLAELLLAPTVADSIAALAAAARPPVPTAPVRPLPAPEPVMRWPQVVATFWRPDSAELTTFRGARWMVVGPMESDSVWNSNVMNQADRVSRAAQGSVLQVLKLISGRIPATAHGVALQLGLRNRNFAQRPAPLADAVDQTVWYIPRLAWRQLENADITLPQFYAQTFVLVGGVRVEVDLGARAR